MAWDEFKTCAEGELNFAIDSWREVLETGAAEIQAIKQYLESSSWGQWVLERAEQIGGQALRAALTRLAALVGASEAVVAACIAIAAAAGVSIGTVIWVLGNCAGQL